MHLRPKTTHGNRALRRLTDRRYAIIVRAPAAGPVFVGAGAPWSAVFGVAFWIAYKFVKGVIIGLGLGGTGLPTTIGALAALALYTASVRLIERRSPDELGLADLAELIDEISTDP